MSGTYLLLAFAFHSLSLTHQTLSVFVVLSILLRHQPTFSVLSFLFWAGPPGQLHKHQGLAWPVPFVPSLFLFFPLTGRASV